MSQPCPGELRCMRVLLAAALLAAPVPDAAAQADPLPRQREDALPDPHPRQKGALPAAPSRVDINPRARDEEIGTRLQRVLEATEWFAQPRVRVDEGVVFLEGLADSDGTKKWAGDLARNTQDVVAVVNRIDVAEPSIWDFGPAWSGLFAIWQGFVRTLPFVVFGLLVLGLSALASRLVAQGARSFLRPRIEARLLRNVVAGTLGALVFLAGTYIVLRVAGLTQVAFTVIGGTGLVGLAIGIAFRDITENFLASIFLSMQRPFETGDLLEVDGVTGYVQQLNVRTTVLMNLEGNVVQIPNATVYKSNLRNFSTNCNRREDFVVGIGYGDSIVAAQEVARQVLMDHPAVLKAPEPAVLVDDLGKATVNLRVYFWLDGSQHSWLKVRSSTIRLVKRAFQANGISMPDEAREIVFPEGVPVTMLDAQAAVPREGAARMPPGAEAAQPQAGAAATQAEGGLQSEAGVIEEQARKVVPLHTGDNLLSGERSRPDAH
jgi:small conductance mechanosensitive channel